MKTKTVQLVSSQYWDELVKKTYGRPYCLQQQEGCPSAGTYHLSVPERETNDDLYFEEVPARLDTHLMGVPFDRWLARDPQEPLEDRDSDYAREIWWERNFYPDIKAVANDLHLKGLLPVGEYVIDITY